MRTRVAADRCVQPDLLRAPPLAECGVAHEAKPLNVPWPIMSNESAQVREMGEGRAGL